MKTRPEIMAPVGSFDALAAAINAGCDSVFFGVQQLNMRARSSYNFTLEDLKEVAKHCKKAGIRSYITLNTILFDHDLVLMRRIVDKAKEAGIDAIIAQDMAAIQYAREIGMKVQASTQLSISNYESAKFYAQFADTIVLAREVDLEMMQNICDRIKKEDLRGPSGDLVKVEVFVHGALCIAQSGRCHMSVLTTNTSAQRGACLQECRKQYRVIEEETGNELKIENEFVMSPKDLCCLPFLDKVAASGVAIFKIEGRGRSAQYVDTVTRVYRQAADAITEGTFSQKKIDGWMKELSSVYNRGFCDGYYLGKTVPDWSGYSGNQSTDERVYVGLVNHYFTKKKIAELDVQAHQVRKGDRLVIMGKTTGVVKGNVEEIMKDEEFVEDSGKPSLVTVPLSKKVRKNDKIYILKKRNLNVLN